jgi:hypothetical protein
MKTFQPGKVLRLWLLYQENGIPISGKSNLSVEVLYENAQIFSSTLSEEDSKGIYFVDWDTSLETLFLEEVYEVRFLEDTTVIAIEEYRFDDNIKKIVDMVSTIRDIETGKWEIVANQMIFYSPEGDEIARFDLFDQSNNPTMQNVFRREPV